MLAQLNSWPLYLISGVVILFVIAFSIFFMVRAWRAGVAIGIDKQKLRRAVTASATFSLLPSISILLGVIALAGSLGVPLPWMRLSVVGALHYETSVADIAAKSAGLSGLDGNMTAEVFATVGLLMAVGIIWGVLCMALFGKRYCSRLQRSSAKKAGGKSFGDSAMTAMFIGLITAYLGSYVGTLVQLKGGALVVTGNYLPLVTLAFSAAAMAVFTYFSEKKKVMWLDNFSIAGSMLVGMTAAVIVGIVW